MNPDPVVVQSLQIMFAVMLGSFALTLLILLAVWVVMAFALIALFRKVGVKPWIAWVPYYRTWVWLELGGQPGWLALLSLVGAGTVTSIFLYIGMYRTGLAFRRDGGFLVLGIFFPYAWAFILSGRDSRYEPALLSWYGYPPPGVGHGSVAPNFANDETVVPGAPPPPPFAAQAAQAAQTGPAAAPTASGGPGERMW